MKRQRIHFRTCLKCGEAFYTYTKYTKTPLCNNCSNIKVKQYNGKRVGPLDDFDLEEFKKELKKYGELKKEIQT